MKDDETIFIKQFEDGSVDLMNDADNCLVAIPLSKETTLDLFNKLKNVTSYDIEIFTDSEILKLKTYVCSVFQIHKIEALKSKARPRKHVVARQVCFYILYARNYNGLTAIGRLFNRDHATVLHGLGCINTALSCKDPLYYNEIKKCLIEYNLWNNE